MHIWISPALSSRWLSSAPYTDASTKKMLRAVKQLTRVSALPYPLASDLRSIDTCTHQLMETYLLWTPALVTEMGEGARYEQSSFKLIKVPSALI
jgi:hypothetical protein